MDRNRGDTRPSQCGATIDTPCVVEKVTYKPPERGNKDQGPQVDPRHFQSKELGHPLVKESRHSFADALSEKKKSFDPRHPPGIDKYVEERGQEAARVRGEREMATFLDKWEDKWKK